MTGISHCPCSEGRAVPGSLSPRRRCLIAPDPKAGTLLLPCPQALPPQGPACPQPQRWQFTSRTHRCPAPGSTLHPGPSRGPVPHPGSGRGPAPVAQPGAWPRLPPRSSPSISPGPAPGSVPARPHRRAWPDAPVSPRRPGPDPGPTALPFGKCSPALAMRRRACRD